MLNPRIQIPLPPAGMPLFIDGNSAVTLTDSDHLACVGSIAGLIGMHLAGSKIRGLSANQSCLTDTVIAETRSYRVLRNPVQFARGLPEVLTTIAKDLTDQMKDKPGNYVLEVGFSDSKGFAEENRWSDFIYIFARIAPDEAR